MAARLLALTLLLAVHGCSFIFTDGGPRPHCSTSKFPPVLDTLVGLYQVARTGFAVSASDSTYEDALLSREADIAFGLGFSALFIASAYHGYATTMECDRRSDPGPPPDESGDLRVTARGRRVGAAPEQRPAVRTELHLGSWELSLLGVPEAEPDTVAVRIESRFRAQRFKGCSELQLIVGGTPFRHHASYRADVVSGQLREVFMARVPVAELVAMTTAPWSSVGVCGHHQLLGGAAQTHIRSFVQQHATRRASPGVGTQPTPRMDGSPIAVTDINVTLTHIAGDVSRQPGAFAEHAFVMLPGVRVQTPGCEALAIAVDADVVSKPLRQRPGVDPAPFAALEIALLKRIAASTHATLGICGRRYKLSAADRAALTALADDLKPAAAPEPVAGDPQQPALPARSAPATPPVPAVAPTTAPPATAPPATAPPRAAAPVAAPPVAEPPAAAPPAAAPPRK